MSGCGVSDAKGKEEKLAQNARLVDQHLYEWYFSSHSSFSLISFPFPSPLQKDLEKVKAGLEVDVRLCML